MITTWGYHYAPPLPDSVEIDGVTFDRIERLPRNLRPGDLLAIGDNIDRAQYHRAFVKIVCVDSWPQSFHGIRRYAPRVQISFILGPGERDSWRWKSWGNTVNFHGEETHERMDWAYRARAVKNV